MGELEMEMDPYLAAQLHCICFNYNKGVKDEHWHVCRVFELRLDFLTPPQNYFFPDTTDSSWRDDSIKE